MTAKKPCWLLRRALVALLLPCASAVAAVPEAHDLARPCAELYDELSLLLQPPQPADFWDDPRHRALGVVSVVYPPAVLGFGVVAAFDHDSSTRDAAVRVPRIAALRAALAQKRCFERY